MTVSIVTTFWRNYMTLFSSKCISIKHVGDDMSSVWTFQFGYFAAKTGYDEAGWEEEEEECSQCDVASSDGHSRGEAGGGDPRVDTRGIHRAGRLTIDNRRCISFDLPNMAKKPHSTSWMYGWILESQYRLYIERSKGSKFTPESL